MEAVKEALADDSVTPHQFEDLICQLFEQNGYILKNKNHYDREGGDADLLFEAAVIRLVIEPDGSGLVYICIRRFYPG